MFNPQVNTFQLIVDQKSSLSDGAHQAQGYLFRADHPLTRMVGPDGILLLQDEQRTLPLLSL
jgi:hypothetical protein